MPDDRTKRGRHDRERVSTTEEWEARYWADKFDCTHAELVEAAEAVGPMVKDVQRYLDQRGEH